MCACDCVTNNLVQTTATANTITNSQAHTHTVCNMCVCLPMTAAAVPAYCVVKCSRLLHGASSALSECPAAWHLPILLSSFPPPLLYLLLCRRATFFTFLAAYTKQAGNISVINIGLVAHSLLLLLLGQLVAQARPE